jgi:hypothetical protein
MLWLLPIVIACLAGGVFLWTRGLQVPGVLLLLVAFALVFVLGRGLEARRDKAWQEAAARLQATFRAERPCTTLDGFGAPAPWSEWSRDGELRCLRFIEGQVDGVPYALVQIRYSVRERRGEEHPDSWYEVTVAAVQRVGGAAAGALVAVPAPNGYVAMQNGRSLFLWKKGSPGVGASLDARELPALLDEARRMLAR